MMKKIKLNLNKFAFIDSEDFNKVSAYKWYADKSGNGFYAVANSKDENGKHKKIRMHQFIFGKKIGFQIDHIDGNGLNNMKSNLRYATHSQNQHNRKKYTNNTSDLKGVFWHKNKKKWYSAIRVSSKLVHLGYFDSKLKAHETYCKAALRFHGDFARIN